MALTQYMDTKKHTLARTQHFTSTQSSVCSATWVKDTVPDFVCRAASIRCLALPAAAAADWTRTVSSAAAHRFTRSHHVGSPNKNTVCQPYGSKIRFQRQQKTIVCKQNILSWVQTLVILLRQDRVFVLEAGFASVWLM